MYIMINDPFYSREGGWGGWGGRDYMKHIKVGRHGLYGAGQDLGNDCFKAKTPY